MNYSEAIKLLRIKLILTQTEFAKMLNVSLPSVNRWESGKYEPTMKIKKELIPMFEKYGIHFE